MGRKPQGVVQFPYFFLAALISVILFVACAGGVIIFGYPYVFTPDQICHDRSLGEIEAHANFTLPASAADFGERCEKGLYMVWFTMPASDQDAFLATTRVKSPLGAAKSLPDFGPEAALDSTRYGEYRDGDWRSIITQQIWIDQADRTRYRVHLAFLNRITAD